ncbi:MAG: hypothetical protein Hens3KO_10560 [Henriciella sp.]
MALKQTVSRVSERIFDFERSGDFHRYKLAFIAILGLSALLRLWNIGGPSLWMDEAVAVALSQLPLEAILFERIDNHPPLLFLIEHFWLKIVPDSEWARVPFAVAGIATVGVIMGLMRDQASRRAALIAGLLLALTTGHIYYSQEARMYTLLVLGLALAMWGAIGIAQPARLKPLTYAVLYLLGGVIAIYCHFMGLVGMAAISFSVLAVSLVRGPVWPKFRAWLLINSVMFVLALPWLIQIPAYMGFGGINARVTVFETAWYLMKVTGFPGLGSAGTIVSLVYCCLVGAGLIAAWLNGRYILAAGFAGVLICYPLLLIMLSFDRPIIAARIMLPVVIGVCCASGLALASFRNQLLAWGLTALFIIAAALSSAHHLAHPIKPENFTGAFAHIEREGFAEVPVLTCIDMSASAAWETKPEADIYLFRRGEIMLFPGPRYWQIARLSMTGYYQAPVAEIDAYLGGKLHISGGMADAFITSDKIAFVRPFCEADTEAVIMAQLQEIGFVEVSKTLITDGAPNWQIMANPRTKVSLYRRDL